METNQNRDTIIEYRDTADRYKDTSIEEVIKKVIECDSLTLDDVAEYCLEEGQGGLKMLQDIGYPIKDFSYSNGIYRFVLDENSGFTLNMGED